MKPRLGIVVRQFTNVGGCETVAYESALRLAKDGDFEVHVFAGGWTAPAPGVQLHRLPRFPMFRPWRARMFARRVAAALARVPCDLVHSHERVYSADVCSLHGTPHEYWARTVRGRTRMTMCDRSELWAERRMLASRRCRVLLPVSSLVESLYRQQSDLHDRQVTTIVPGADLKAFAQQRRDACRRKVRDAHGIGSQDLVLLFTSMNWKHKGLFELLDAVAAVDPLKRSLRVLIVGRGNEVRVKRAAQAHGWQERVHFAGVVTSDIARYYHAADAFVLPSTFDTFGIVVLEAMAAGLPVVVSRQVGACELLRPGKNGLVIDSREDAAGLRQAIAALMHPGRRRALGREALQTAQGYDWMTHVNKLKAIYDQLLRERRPLKYGTDTPAQRQQRQRPAA